MNRLTQPITLYSLFQFENLLKSNLHSWCGIVWHIHILTVFLNSKLLFSANSNFCCGQSVLLPCKNSGPFHHVLQPDNATITIPWLPISAGFILPLTKFHWVGSFTVWISPIWLATKDLNFLLGFFTLYKTFMLSHQKADFFITWSPKTSDTSHKCNPNITPSSSN